MTGREMDKAGTILFGLSRADDERSLAVFLSLLANPELCSVLIPRLSDAEVGSIVDLFSTLMRTHLSEEEYHRLFLHETDHIS